MYFTARAAAARKEFRLDETLVENEGARFLFRRPVVIQVESRRDVSRPPGLMGNYRRLKHGLQIKQIQIDV
ncbi:Hypothetical protein SMAX5B_007083 [Scophthalmus maximus]|uniref:Uncharacterized protein n=1 Tax=Scophthalmus maximus TaxID=52904 RepID=A0A2U9B0Q7_SCOMX|nr:Hypothetical protein SMAX5B_007083 [Scophthalmus maximus]